MSFTASPVALGVALGTEEKADNTANTVVLRDASGNFAAGTITAALTGNVTGDVSGNAATATKLNSSRTFALTGDVTGSVSSDLTSGASIAATITNDAVTADKLRDDASTDANRAVTTNHIRNGAVTAAKLDSGIPVCRAWVCFDGTRNAADTGASVNGGTVKIKASHNVSSVNRVAGGEYTITFSTALADANYAFAGTANYDGGASIGYIVSAFGVALSTSKTSSSLRISIMIDHNTEHTTLIPHDVCVIIFR
jgi:molybdopterin-binding protein